MTTIRSTLLLAGAVIAGATGAAQATTIYGGGASLPAPYFRQAADCWGDKIGLAFRGVPTTTNINDFNYTGATAFNCATQTVAPGNTVTYISTGSGRGILGYFAHTADGPGTRNADFAPATPTLFGNDIDWLGNGANAAPALYATKVNFALSETALGSADVGAADDLTPTTVGRYTNGGTISQSGLSIDVVAPGVTPSSDISGTTRAQFPNPRTNYGRAIQVPILIAPVTIAYDPVYKKVASAGGSVTEFTFTIGSPRSDGSGGLRVSRSRMCSIFGSPSGSITTVTTNYNQIASSVVAKDPDDSATFDVPLQIVGRSDGSGTTSIWTRHLSAVCGTAVYAESSSTLPRSTRNAFPATASDPTVPNGGGVYDKSQPNNPAPNEVLGRYTIADGNDGVAKYLDFTRVPSAGDTIVQGRVGYVGADYALPYVLVSGQNEFGLNTASVQNRDLNYVSPTPAAALAAFGSVRAPQSTSSGTYSSSAPGDRRDPSAGPNQWVLASSRTATIADPNPSGTSFQYPIVGTTNALIYQCYASIDEAAVVRNFYNWYWSTATVNGSVGILQRQGFSPLPLGFRTAMRNTFINGTSISGANLSIQETGASSAAPACRTVPGA